MRSIWYVVLGVVLSVVLAYLWHRHTSRVRVPMEEVVVTIDTLLYSSVPPDSITTPTSCDSLPLYHFSDTVDGRWSAQVAGCDVELRSLVLRDSYESRRITTYSPPTWEVTARGGFSDLSGWIGIGVDRNVGRLKMSLGAGYDPINQSSHVEGSVGLVLWREY